MTDVILFSVDLPMPGRRLSPNGRVHWATRYRLAKRYRHTSHVLALEALAMFGIQTPVPPGRYRVELLGRHRRGRQDQDNLIATLKPGLDGLAEAMGIDDAAFELVVTGQRESQEAPGVVVTVVRL